MKAKLLLWLLLLYSGSTWAQNLSIQESFEAPSGDYGYTSNTFNTSLTQYFYRAQNTVPGFGNPAGSANMINVNGSSFWACEGVRGTGNTTPTAGLVPGIVTLNAINNTQNYTDLKVIVAAGDPRSGANIARTTDHLRVQYAYGDPNGTYTTLFEFTGTVNGSSSSWTRVAVQGTNVTGTAAVLSSTFSDHESSIPGGVGALYIRVEADYQGSNKELAFDNIRVTGTRATSAAPQLANIESTSVNYAEGSGPVQITNTLTVADADNTTLTGGTVRIAANLEATEDQLLYTNGSGITGSYVTGTGVLTLSGTATLAAYQAALRSVQYQNTDAVNASPLARTIVFSVTDPSGTTSNVATRTVTVTTALNAASALPYTENFDTDDEGTRYGSNTRVSNSQGFVRLSNASGGSATPGSGFVNGTTTTFTNVQGPGYWYTNGTQGGIVSGSVGQLTLAPVNSTGFVNLHFKVRVGAASSGGGFTSNEFLRFSYSTDGGTTWTIFANYTGASGQLYLNGSTTNPVLDTSLDNADFALPTSLNGTTISFRAETNSGGSEQIVFDDIQITGTQQTTVNAIVRASANPTNATTVNYTVTFGAAVTGLTVSNFSLTTTGTVSGTLGTPVVGTGNTWTVPVNSITGGGTLTLSLANDTNLSVDVTNTLPFAGETYTIDKTAPVVSSVVVPANGTYRVAQTLSFGVNFSEAVTVTGTPQLALTIGSTTRQATYVSGSGSTALTFSYPVVSGDLDTDGITLASALALNGGTIRDAVSNNATLALNGVPSTAGVLVDAVAPTVVSSVRQTPATATTGATSLTFRVTFSEAVTGVTTGSFALTTSGSTSGTIASVAAVSGSNGTQVDVTVNSVSGNGTVRLDVKSSGSGISDAAGNALSGGYTSGETYTLSQSVTVVSVTRLTPSPTATTQVSYQVVFSGSVAGLTMGNFTATVTSGSLSGASVSSVSTGPGTTYTVGVNTGTGNGTLRLDVTSSTGTTPSIANVPYTAGQEYTITRSFAAAPTLRIQAAGSASGNFDVTAFVDVVQVLNASNGSAVATGLQNGSFETNNVAPNTFKKTSDGVAAAPWSFTGTSGVTRNNTTTDFGPPTPTTGNAVALVQSVGDNNASLSQNLAVPTGSYQVNFQTAQRNYTSRDQRLNVFVNDVFVGSIQPAVYTSYESFTSAPFSVTAPGLTATVSTTSASPTSTAPIPFAVSFSQNVGTSFTAADVTVTGGTLTSGSFSGTGPYTFTVTPSGTGTVSVSLAANVALDANNTFNSASSPVSVQYNQPVTAAPVIAAPANGTLTNQAVTFTGTAPANSQVLLYVSQGGTVVSGSPFSVAAQTDGTFSFGPFPFADGTYQVYATAQSPGASVSANSNTNTFTVDTTRPTVILTSSSGASGSTNVAAPFTFRATFSESVSGFVAGDISVTNGTVSNFIGTAGSSVYTFDVTPNTLGAVTSVFVFTNSSQDLAGNGNMVSNTYSLTSAPPVVTVAPASGSLTGGTVGAAYSQTITASGATAPYTYAITAGALPAGLTLSSAGVLSGTPTAGGSFTFTVTATDNSAAPGPYSGSRTYTLPIGYPDLVISTSGQLVPAGTYHSITVQRGGVGTLAGDVTVNGDVTVQSGGVLNDGCALISGAGSFTLAAGGTLSICSAQGISSSGAIGTVQVTGTRSFSPDALYSYTGSVAQITGTGLPPTVRALTLTNPAGLSLTNAVTTTTAATFTSGVLTTGASTLTLGSGATLSEDADGYVTGTVLATRNLATAGSPEAFGGLGLMLTPSGSTLPGSTLVRRVTGTALHGAGTSTSITRYFDIQPTVNTGLNVALVLTARDDERNGIAAANLRLFKSADNGSSWQQQPATVGTATVSGLTTYSASLSGISDFSLWTLGDAAAPLPVTLTSFQALLQDENRALLRWATASELHSAYFAVERSLDGRTFVEVGRVAAAGTSLSAHTYELRDPLPLTGPTYYRLRQVDADKSATYSPVVTLAPSTQPAVAVSVYPNPRRGLAATSVSVQGLLNQPLTVKVTDMLGRTISSQQVTPTTSQATLPLPLPADLAAGIYSVSVQAGKQMWTTRLTVAP